MSPRAIWSVAVRRSRKKRRTPSRWVARAAVTFSSPASVSWAKSPRPSVRGGAAGDVAQLDEPVDEAGAAAAAEQHAAGDVRHAHAVLGRVGEEHQDLVGRDREPVLGVHLGVELLGDAGVGLEHAAPGRELVPGQRGSSGECDVALRAGTVLHVYHAIVAHTTRC